ncbi:MAG: hypothetical protein IAE80_26235 [Anaerolinea sp.]|nr:hypothetical protein [Anaerolinea sp.]
MKSRLKNSEGEMVQEVAATEWIKVSVAVITTPPAIALAHSQEKEPSVSAEER